MSNNIINQKQLNKMAQAVSGDKVATAMRHALFNNDPAKIAQVMDATADTQKYDAKALLAPYEADTGVGKGEPGACAEALLRLTLGWVPEEPKKALVAFAAANGNTMSNQVLTGMLLLISTMPEYQMC